MRGAAEAMLRDVDGLMADAREAFSDSIPEVMVADPGLRAALHESISANMVHWLGQVIVDPTVPVLPTRNRAAIELARDLIRRGFDPGAARAFRIGQHVGWQRWMSECFVLTPEPAALSELLEHSWTSMSSYVEASVASVEELTRSEREQLTQGSVAERLNNVNLLLGGARWKLSEAGDRLGHDFRTEQTAAILWQDPLATNRELLVRIVQGVARDAGLPIPLTVSPNSSTLWAWYAGDAAISADGFTRRVGAHPGVFVALGAAAYSLEGFRASHADAVVTQAFMLRAPGALQVASYDDVQVATLVATDASRAVQFAARTLGALARADPALREMLRTYLVHDSNAAATARALYTHRNTVLKHLAKAESLLPIPLAGNSLRIGLALEVEHWLGGRASP